MPTNLYRMRTGATQTISGRELLDTMNTLADVWARIVQHQEAMAQEQDDASGTDSAFQTPATIYGFITAADMIDPATAHEAYLEINSFIAAAGPALRQLVARFRQ